VKTTVAYVVGVIVWTFAVFVGTFWLTFPSETLAERIEYEVPRVLGDRYVAEVGSVSPWWAGVSVSDVKLYELPAPERPSRRSRADEGEDEADGGGAAPPQLVAMLGNARVRASLWSLFRRAPYVSGAVRLTEGEIEYAVGTAADEQGDIGLADLVITADDLPLSDLMLLLPLSASGSGVLDIDVDLHAGDGGMRDASGRVSLSGSDLTLSEVELPMVGPLGMDFPIRSLALSADIADGRATIGKGAVDSELFQVGLSGEMTLREPLDRSAIDVTLTLSQLAESLAGYGTFLGSAETSTGTYQYNCRGVISRLNEYSCTAGGTRDRSSAAGRVTRPAGARAVPTPSRDAEGDEERQRRREELRARLQQRREERESQQRPSRPDAMMDDEEPLDDEEFLPEDEDEELLEDELPEEWEEELIE
jgi:type II secretion system protein N